MKNHMADMLLLMVGAGTAGSHSSICERPQRKERTIEPWDQTPRAPGRPTGYLSQILDDSFQDNPKLQPMSGIGSWSAKPTLGATP